MFNQNHLGVCLTQHVIYSKAQLQTPVTKKSTRFSDSAGNLKFRNKTSQLLSHWIIMHVVQFRHCRDGSRLLRLLLALALPRVPGPVHRDGHGEDAVGRHLIRLLRTTDSNNFSDLWSFSLILNGRKLFTHPGLPGLLVDQRSWHLVQKLHWVLRLQRRMWDTKKMQTEQQDISPFLNKEKTSRSQTDDVLNGKHQGPVALVGFKF